MTTYTDMVAKFRKRTSGLGASLTEDEILGYLDEQYIYVLPTEVDGPLFEKEYVFLLGSGAVTRDIPDYFKVINTYSIAYRRPTVSLPPTTFYPDETEPRESIFLEWDFNRFLRQFPDYADTTVTGGDATTIAVFADKFHLNRRPGNTRAFYVRGRSVPQAAYNTAVPFEVAGEPIGVKAAGSLEFTVANAVIAAAAREYLSENEDEAGTLREEAQYQKYLSILRTKSHSMHRPRRNTRTF